MAFQFLCPQGHLLEGDPSQAGRQCQCPHCKTVFLIPSPAEAAPADATPMPPPQAQPGQPTPPPSGPPTAAEPEAFPGIRTTDDSEGSGVRPTAPKAPAASDTRPELVHIACPSGHELETPREMLGKLAVCPFCREQFHLRWEESVEYRRRRVEQLERKQAKAAQLWLKWSIGAAVAVVLGLILMVILSG